MNRFFCAFAAVAMTAASSAVFAAPAWIGSWDLVSRACASGAAVNPDVQAAVQGLSVSFTPTVFTLKATAAGCALKVTANYTAAGNIVTTAPAKAVSSCSAEAQSLPAGQSRNVVSGNTLTITFTSGAFEPACAAGDSPIYTFKRH
jgi:hypothetical protein